MQLNDQFKKIALCKVARSITQCQSNSTFSSRQHTQFHQLTTHKNGHRISPDLNLLDYSVGDILQCLVYEGRRDPNLKDLENVSLSETNGMLSTIRQSEKLYCNGKGI